MRFIFATLLTGVLGFIAGIYLPWWSIAIIAFLVSIFIRQTLLKSFLAGFLGIFILWAMVALWIDVKNGSILSRKIAMLFPLGGSTGLLIMVTSIVGGIVGGFAALAGASVYPKKKRYGLHPS
jgi:hypothetical protein